MVRRSSIILAPALQRDAVLAKQILAPTFQSARSHRIVATSHQAQLDKLVLVRFGGLAPEAQRVLRTASIIGVTFTADVLHAALPAHLKPELQECLHLLVLQMWLYEDSDSDQRYTFAHPHTQQIIYELTPASERNVLYALVAEYVEGKYGTDPLYFAALSHYFLHFDTDKALQYVIRAQATLLLVGTMYDFADAVNLLGSSLAACKCTLDVDVLVKASADCKRAIDCYGKQPTAATGNAAVVGGWTYFFSCQQSHPEKIIPLTGTARVKSGANFSSDTLPAEEQAVRALFLKQLERLDGQLSAVRVDLSEGDDGAEGGAAKDWQRLYLGLPSLV
jgi:hypothetical protein